MRQECLVVAAKKRRKYGSYLGEISPAPDNLINRDFQAATPNEKSLTDIMEFQIAAGKVYLSPMSDCFDGLVVSWSIGTRPDADLVNTMFAATRRMRRPSNCCRDSGVMRRANVRDARPSSATRMSYISSRSRLDSLGDLRVVLRHDRHEASPLKDAQGFADRGTADVEARAQLDLFQALAGRKTLFHDRPGEPIGDLKRQGQGQGQGQSQSQSQSQRYR